MAGVENGHRAILAHPAWRGRRPATPGRPPAPGTGRMIRGTASPGGSMSQEVLTSGDEAAVDEVAVDEVAVEAVAPDDPSDDTEELLVEEISIDGMCGVY